MEFLDLLALASFIVICINGLRFWRSSKSKKLPPGPVGLPIIGNLMQVGIKTPHLTLDALAKQHGPLMTVRLGSVTAVVASSAEMAKEVLQKHDAVTSGRTIPDSIHGEDNYELSMVWLPAGETWRVLRKVCTTQLFTNPALDAYEGLRNEKMKDLMRNVREHCDAKKEINIGRLAFSTILNLVSTTMFSRDFVDINSEGAQEIKDVVWGVMETAGKPNLSDYFPIIKPLDVQGIRRHAKACFDHLHAIADDLIGERLQWRSNGSPKKNDFLDVLLDNAEQPGSGMDRTHVKMLITDLILAGGDTSAATTEWIMVELLRHPATMAKVQQELLEFIGGPGVEVKESDIPRLPYLMAVMKETMRLRPTSPLLLPHKTEKDIEASGYLIPKDTQMLINVHSVGRDKACWENADSYIPERFLESKIDFKGKNWGLIPFGAGRRICPGMPLALRMVPLILASLLNSFDWRFPDGVTPENRDMTPKIGTTVQLASPLMAVPSKRIIKAPNGTSA